MTERQIIKQVKVLIERYGAITVAMSLGYSDPRTPMRWVSLNRIPKHKRLAIEEMLTKFERRSDDY